VVMVNLNFRDIERLFGWDFLSLRGRALPHFHFSRFFIPQSIHRFRCHRAPWDILALQHIRLCLPNNLFYGLEISYHFAALLPSFLRPIHIRPDSDGSLRRRLLEDFKKFGCKASQAADETLLYDRPSLIPNPRRSYYKVLWGIYVLGPKP